MLQIFNSEIFNSCGEKLKKKPQQPFYMNLPHQLLFFGNEIAETSHQLVLFDSENKLNLRDPVQ